MATKVAKVTKTVSVIGRKFNKTRRNRKSKNQLVVDEQKTVTESKQPDSGTVRLQFLRAMSAIKLLSLDCKRHRITFSQANYVITKTCTMLSTVTDMELLKELSRTALNLMYSYGDVLREACKAVAVISHRKSCLPSMLNEVSQHRRILEEQVGNCAKLLLVLPHEFWVPE